MSNNPEDLVSGPCCLVCGTAEGVRNRPSFTAYYWDGKGQNPNRDVPLCEPDFEDHAAHWADMWALARGG
jgi:hypothetical protein